MGGKSPLYMSMLRSSELADETCAGVQPAVALNNAEMALTGREEEEEVAVLCALSEMVGGETV